MLHLLQSRSRVSRSMNDERWRIPSNVVTDRSVEPIARGGFAEVYTAMYFGSDVAMKQLLCMYEEAEIVQFRREIEVWIDLNHPNILKLLGACDTSERPFMVSPLMKNGTLKRYISDVQNPRPMEERLRLMYEVASGMAYLHSKSVVHGDLKSANILLDEGYHAVITDFGMSRTKHTSSSSERGHSVGGTLDYMAPEMLDDDPLGPSKKTDVYAFGILLYEVLKNGGYVWQTVDGHPMAERAIEKQIEKGKRPKQFEGIPDQIWPLVEACWHQDPTQRPAFKGIVSSLSGSRNITPPQTPVVSPRNVTRPLSSGSSVVGMNSIEMVSQQGKSSYIDPLASQLESVSLGSNNSRLVTVNLAVYE
jgi:serine/threonine protein kinase